MGHDGVASGYPTPIGFRRLTGCQRDPQDRKTLALEMFKVPLSLRIGYTHPYVLWCVPS